MRLTPHPVAGGDREPGPARDGLGASGEGLSRRAPTEGSVGPDLVELGPEPVELALEFGDASRPVLFGEPLLQGLVETFDLPTGLGVIGPGVLVGDAEGDQLELDGAALRLSAVNTAPLSVNIEAGRPRSAAPRWKVSTTSAALVVGKARQATSNREWSSMTLRISTSVPSMRAKWVVSACQHSFGSSAWNRRQELFGRFWGWGTTKPLQVRTR